MKKPLPAKPKYIAFLRAVNVGGRIVKMEALRTHFHSLGFSNIETFIASGNVIFESSAKNAQALEKKIENQLQKSLGYRVATFIRSTTELERIANYVPFPISELQKEGNSLYISFLAARPSADLAQKLQALQTEDDLFHTNEREVYWLCRSKISESAITGALFEKTIGMPTTMRNSTTVRKLVAKYPAPQ